MKLGPSFEMGYVFLDAPNGLEAKSLERIAKVSAKLIERIPVISRDSFDLIVDISERVNHGLFEAMSFASFPGTKFEENRQNGGFLPNPYFATSFGAITLGFCPKYTNPPVATFINPKSRTAEQQKEAEEYLARNDGLTEHFEFAVLGASKDIADSMGVPDFFTWGSHWSYANVDREFAKYVLPRVEAMGARFADFNNNSLAVVEAGENSNSHHRYIKRVLEGKK